jgi:hypothetical protein
MQQLIDTNYYAKKVIQFPLTFTVNSYDELEELTVKVKELQSSVHLGKRSEGWNFLGSWNDGVYYSDYQSYLDYINQPDIEIYDDNQNKLTQNEFINIVTEKKGKKHSPLILFRSLIQFPELDFMRGEWC